MWDFVMDELALSQVFSPSTSVSRANLHSTNLSTITVTYHPGLVHQASKWLHYPKSNRVN
jgi:hypothetical protein